MRIGFVCDLHMRESGQSVQAVFFRRAVAQMKADKIETIVTLGDITAWGNREAFDYYCRELEQIAEHHWVLGNSDVRSDEIYKFYLEQMQEVSLMIGTRRLVAISTPFAEITEADREKIEALKDGDILCLHHSIQGLKENDRKFLEQTAQKKRLTIIHGHSHRRQDYTIGETRVIGLRALDPDKSIGDYPCVTYLDITDTEIQFEERIFSLPADSILEVKNYFGISCVDNHRDVKYATEHGVKFIELRCNGADWEPDLELIPLLEQWREKTKGYLSVHMPNLYWSDGALRGETVWYQAVDYAKRINADGLTIHPPRVKKTDMPKGGDVWGRLLDLYVFAVSNMEDKVKIGIENLHMHKGEVDDEYRAFGYTPEEVSSWIDAINAKLNRSDRVGHVLDVGHARNNGVIAERFPISRWYEVMGRRAVAYHIHQVVPTEDGLRNHQPIESWFGPMISYVSFFYYRSEQVLNHAPTFLEVRGCDNYEKSMKAWKETFESV